MINKYYQKHKKKLQKEAGERYLKKIFLNKKKKKDKKSPEEDIKIFLRNKSRSYSSI